MVCWLCFDWGLSWLEVYLTLKQLMLFRVPICCLLCKTFTHHISILKQNIQACFDEHDWINIVIYLDQI